MERIKQSEIRAEVQRLNERQKGVLHFHPHHIVFKSTKNEIWICYPIIAECTRTSASLRLVCHDFMFFKFNFSSDLDCVNAQRAIDFRRRVLNITDLYAFVYQPVKFERMFNSHTLYNAEKEYTRMGALSTGKWRLTECNKDYQLCPTYPHTLAVPAAVSDQVLFYGAKFRSKKRLPVLSYFLKLNNCTISRCSQPLIGIKQQRSMQDEAIINAIFQSNDGPSDVVGAKSDNLIVDLRPSTNAIAQIALGGGTEPMERYKLSRKVYMGVDNLHVMRDSLNKLVDALRHSDVSIDPPSPNSIERSQWLYHLKQILISSTRVVEQVYYKCSHVVVHCSDGWDRTPQITSLSMLMLDPFYRTIDGFIVLVEKEWVSFGHQFGQRGNFVEKNDELEVLDLLKNVSQLTQFLSDTAKGRQDGPIFQQFLDCVYQIMALFPNAFEFNERFLRRLLYHTYACQYGTFLFNSEKERIEQQMESKTRSVWDYFLSRRQQFVNPDYLEADVLVLPNDFSPKWWAQSFGRIVDDMNDGEAWRRTIEHRTQ